MSLIKLAMSVEEIDAKYNDERGLWRRAHGKLMGYTIGLPFRPWGPLAGHLADRARKRKDFERYPKLFKEYKKEK